MSEMWAPNDCPPSSSSGAEGVIAISAIVLTALRSAGSTVPGLGVAAEISLRIIALVQVRLVFFVCLLGIPPTNFIYRMSKTTTPGSLISRMILVALYIPSLLSVVD